MIISSRRAAAVAVAVAATAIVTVAVPAAHASAGVAGQPPTAPVLSYAAATVSGVALGWTAATDDGAVARYEILRDTLFGDEEVLTQVGAGELSYYDSGAPPFANTYRIRALDDEGLSSAPSNAVTGIVHPRATPTEPPPGYSCVAEYYFPSVRFPPNPVGVTSVTILLTNYAEPIDGWRLSWTYPGDVVVGDNVRGVVISQTGNDVVAASVPATQVIGTGATVRFNFNGTWTTTPVPPAEFLLNGVPCATG